MDENEVNNKMQDVTLSYIDTMMEFLEIATNANLKSLNALKFDLLSTKREILEKRTVENEQ